MPIVPVPPPPPPYVAPDLRPVSSKPTAALAFLRDRRTGSIRGTRFTSQIWIRVEGAPLEVRFHMRGDGTLRADQAFYGSGDRGAGTATDVSGAQVAPVDTAAIAGMGRLRAFIRYTVRTSNGAMVRRWSSDACNQVERLVRLDVPDAPANPTFPSTWDSCEMSDEYSGIYVLGRIYGVDRGWAIAPDRYNPKIRLLPAGTYSLEVEVNPDSALADGNQANNKLTIPLRVGIGSWHASDAQCEDDPTDCAESRGARSGMSTSVRPAGRAVHRHANGSTDVHRANSTPGGAREPSWMARMLRRIELRAARLRAEAEAGGRPRAGSNPTPPAGVDLPDLRSAPSYGISTSRMGRLDLLDFGALTWNAGPGRLEVEAFRERGTTLDAYQVFYKDGVRTTRQARGTMIWHAAPGHDHFHFEAFARYRLARLDGTVVRDSGKNSWCIIDTDIVDTTRPGTPGLGSPEAAGNGFGGCGIDSDSIWARMSLTVGAGDYYTQAVAGQSFNITNLPNGAYRILIEANPTGVIAETRTDNNTSIRVVVLGGRPGKRTVRVRAVPTVKDRAIDGALNGSAGGSLPSLPRQAR